jgi:hypothetical protein
MSNRTFEKIMVTLIFSFLYPFWAYLNEGLLQYAFGRDNLTRQDNAVISLEAFILFIFGAMAFFILMKISDRYII